METRDTQDRRALYVLILVFLILAAGIVTAGYFYYRHYEKHYRVGVERQISAIADLKVSELVQWRRERLGVAAVFYRNAAFSSLVRRYFENAEDMEAQEQLRTWIGQVQAHYQYDRVFLLDTGGVERLSVPEGRAPVASIISRYALEVLRSGQVAFVDFQRNEHDQRIYLTVLVPVLEKNNNSRPVGVLAMRVDPEQYLYPFISRWPTPSRTAETLLIRRDGNDALFLNELKFQKDTALNLRFPLERKEMPAVQAALGREGIVEGRDYRGVPVVAALRAVPDSPWFLVARMDTAEVYAPVRERLWGMVVLVCSLLLGAGAGVGLVWRHQRARYYRERYEAAKTLRDLSSRQEAILAAVPDIIMQVDKNKVYTWANRPGFEFFGKDVIGKEAASFFEGVQDTYSLVQPLFNGVESVIYVESWQRRKDGQKRLLAWWCRVLKDENGDVAGALSSARDITEHNRAARALRESEARYRALFEASADGILIADIETKAFRYANPALCQMFGYAEEELRTMGVADIHPKEALRSVAAEFEARARGKRTFAPDIPCLRKDGTVFFADISAVTIPLAGRTCNVGFFRDITERKRAEEHIRRLNRLYAVLSNINQAIVRIRESQALFEEVCRVAVEDGGFRMAWIGLADPATGKVDAVAHAGVTDGYLEKLHIVLDDAARGEGPTGSALRAGEHVVCNDIERDPRMAPWREDALRLGYRSSATFPLKVFGQVQGAFNLYADTPGFFDEEELKLLDELAADLSFAMEFARQEAERKRTEEQRDRIEAQFLQAQKMEAVGRLAGGVAHDFNNMLNVIIGYADMALSRLDSRDPLYQDLQEIHHAARRSSDLTRQLLAFSRKQVVKPRVVSLNQVIAGQRKMLGRMIGEDIEIRFLPAGELWNIRIDPSQIDQILANLAVNSRDAIKGAGSVTIETANAVLDETITRHDVYVSPGDYVMLSFSDTGVGMDAATLARVFEPFFTTKMEGKGTGLGLATVYGIVRQNEGTIHAYSEPGMGTTFKIYFLRFRGEVDASAEKAEKASLAGTETVLIVEDEEHVLEIAKRILERHGYKVLAARTPGEACRICEQHEGGIRLLLTDVVMPAMNGKELQARIAERKPGIKTLFMSGYTADVIAQRGVLDEGIDFIQKPFSVESLAKKVREVLDS